MVVHTNSEALVAISSWTGLPPLEKMTWFSLKSSTVVFVESAMVDMGLSSVPWIQLGPLFLLVQIKPRQGISYTHRSTKWFPTLLWKTYQLIVMLVGPISIPDGSYTHPSPNSIPGLKDCDSNIVLIEDVRASQPRETSSNNCHVGGFAHGEMVAYSRSWTR